MRGNTSANQLLQHQQDTYEHQDPASYFQKAIRSQYKNKGHYGRLQIIN